MTFDVVKSGGNRLIYGNGRIARASTRTCARMEEIMIGMTTYPNFIDSGLHFQIEAGTSGAEYAIVTGAGLGAGALYYTTMGNSSFEVAGIGVAYNGANS